MSTFDLTNEMKDLGDPVNGRLISLEEALQVDAIDEFYRYWESKQTSSNLPRRKSINPSEFVKLLPWIFIFDLDDLDGVLGDITIRLMGTQVAKVYGEQGNIKIADLKDKDVARRITLGVTQCYLNKAPIAAKADILSRNKPYLAVTVIYCPLSDDGENVDQVIGIVNVSHTKHIA